VESTPVGPDVTGPAQFGLCTAWSASGKPKNPGAIAFKNLSDAATAAGQTVEEFCAPVIAAHEAAHGAGNAPAGQGQDRGQSGQTHGQSGETHGKSGQPHGKP
jgi:hypothetical protein